LSNRTAHLHWYSASSPQSTNTKSHGKLVEYLHWRGKKVVRSGGEILSAPTRNISVFFFLGFLALVFLANHMSQIAAFCGANPSRAHPGEKGRRWLGRGMRRHAAVVSTPSPPTDACRMVGGSASRLTAAARWRKRRSDRGG
jgi:hypothetical protein